MHNLYPKIDQQTHLLCNTMLVPLHLDCGSNSPEVMDEELARENEEDHLPKVDSTVFFLCVLRTEKGQGRLGVLFRVNRTEATFGLNWLRRCLNK